MAKKSKVTVLSAPARPEPSKPEESKAPESSRETIEGLVDEGRDGNSVASIRALLLCTALQMQILSDAGNEPLPEIIPNGLAEILVWCADHLVDAQRFFAEGYERAFGRQPARS